MNKVKLFLEIARLRFEPSEYPELSALKEQLRKEIKKDKSLMDQFRETILANL